MNFTKEYLKKLEKDLVNTQEDVVKNLFNDKYTEGQKKRALSNLENVGLLNSFIRKYHPKYFDKTNNTIKAVSLSIDLHWIDKP